MDPGKRVSLRLWTDEFISKVIKSGSLYCLLTRIEVLTYLCFVCRGAGPGCNTREISDKLVLLKDELERLEDQERQLDEQRLWVQQSLKNVSEDPENEQLAYATYEDVCHSFRGDTLLVVQAPSGTQLEVPIPETVSTSTCF